MCRVLTPISLLISVLLIWSYGTSAGLAQELGVCAETQGCLQVPEIAAKAYAGSAVQELASADSPERKSMLSASDNRDRIVSVFSLGDASWRLWPSLTDF